MWEDENCKSKWQNNNNETVTITNVKTILILRIKIEEKSDHWE